MKLKKGDRVRIKYGSDVIEGDIVSEKDLILKLDSGYNIPLKKSKIKKIEKLKSIKKKTQKKKKIKSNNKLKKIIILHTGGTLASKVDYTTGGVSPSFSEEEILDMFPELNKIANIKSELVFNILSEDMNFSNYVKLADKIKNNVNKVDGIIITHGTDTMGYTSAALSFIFENLPIPVIFVGSQRSSDRGSTDSAMNLICAAEFIAKTNYKGVAICMHDSSSDTLCNILNPCKTRKMHTSRRDAFKSINEKPIAKIDYKTREIDNTKFDNSSEKLITKNKFEKKVALIKFYPEMDPKLLSVLESYKGIILEGTGLGHVSKDLINEIKKLVKKGVIIVMTSQCIFGKINMNVYGRGRELIKAGVISGEDMLSETAYIKLSWLLGNFKKDKAKYMINDNLRGEIKDRLLYEEDFLK